MMHEALKFHTKEYFCQGGTNEIYFKKYINGFG
jgi:hypothetical protein